MKSFPSRRGFFKGVSSGALVAAASGVCEPAQRKQGILKNINEASGRLVRNAKIVLTASCRAKKGESVLLLADEILLPYAAGIAQAALELGLIPTIMDIRHYLASEPYRRGYVMKAVAEAMKAADIVIENLADTWVPNRPSYGRLSGDPLMQDKALSGERRWMILQCGGLDQWEVAATEIEIIQQRTRWLYRLLKNAKTGRITSPGGTDLTFGLGAEAGLTNVLGIIPFYGEVAVTPALSNTSGVFVIDRCTQEAVRPAGELDRQPLRITVERGRAVDMSGDPVQLARLKRLIQRGDPPADAVDEVGIVTTHLRENNLYYWSDGTHRYDCVHIALGNNVLRGVVVHGSVHMDGEVSKPTIAIDGVVVTKDGTFQDQVMRGTR